VSDRATLLILALPALVLAAGSFLRSVPGEWCQTALLAWTAVGLGFVAGRVSETQPLAAVGLGLGFLALAVGGVVGLTGLAVVYVAVAAAAVAGVLTWPWPIAALLGFACAAGAARSLVQ